MPEQELCRRLRLLSSLLRHRFVLRRLGMQMRQMPRPPMTLLAKRWPNRRLRRRFSRRGCCLRDNDIGSRGRQQFLLGLWRGARRQGNAIPVLAEANWIRDPGALSFTEYLLDVDVGIWRQRGGEVVWCLVRISPPCRLCRLRGRHAVHAYEAAFADYGVPEISYRFTVCFAKRGTHIGCAAPSCASEPGWAIANGPRAIRPPLTPTRSTVPSIASETSR